MARMVDLSVTKLLWVPDGGIASITAPTAAELTAAGVKDLTCAIVAGYTLGMTDSDVISDKAACDDGNTTDYGRSNYEADMTFFSPDPADTTSVYATAKGLFTARNIYGYWVRRVGKPQSSAIVATDKVDIFYVSADWPRVQSGGDGSTFVKFGVKFGQQSKFKLNVAVV